MAAPKFNANVDEHRKDNEQILKDQGIQKNGPNLTLENSDSGATGSNNGRASASAWADSETAAKATVSLLAGSPNQAKIEQFEQCQESKSKTDKIREVVEQATSEDSKKKIDSILADIQQLSDQEKLLLYLRLPTGTKVEVDPLKQSFVSSLGNRYEVTQTVTWIQTHLEENLQLSLPKQEVYDGYSEFCQRVKMKALSTADFGKVMKQVFPTVRPRRLGTRGNSRYCYAGLQKKESLHMPQLPDLSLTHNEVNEDSDPTDPELTEASSHLIREWAEKLLGQKFLNLNELAVHLVDGAYVTNRSVAAFQLVSAYSTNTQGKGNQPSTILNSSAGSKHREAQLQLQRKLQERELIREQKKKLLEQRGQVGRSQGEKTSKSGRKSQLKQQNDSLRNLLAVENGTLNHSVANPKDLALSKADTPKDEKAGSSRQFSFDLNGDKTAIPNACGGQLRSDVKPNTPVHFLHSSGSVPVSPCRRKSGDHSTGSSPRPSPLDSGCTSGWATPSSDSSAKGTLRCNVSRCRLPELMPTPPSVTESSKAAKVMIPRVTGSQSSKMHFQPSGTSIIFVNQISGVPITDYGNAQKLKSKYKPIQPKPANLRIEAENGKAVEDNGSCECASVNENNNGTPDSTPRVTPVMSLVNSGSKGRRSTSGSQGELLKAPDESEMTLSDKPSALSSKARLKPGNRKQKRANDSKEVVLEPLKRPCLRLPESTLSDGDARTGLLQSKPALCPDSPQEEMSITSLENDALLEYMNETTSADQEDELLQYFGVGACKNLQNLDERSKAVNLVNNAGGQSAELSQLRKLLEQNLQCKNVNSQSDAADCSSQSASLKAEISNGATMAKDNMPTLRLLLSEQRGKSALSLATVQNLLLESTRAAAHPGSLTQINQMAGLIYDDFRQVTNQCETSALSDNNLQVDPIKAFSYLDDPSREEVWNQGTYGAAKMIRNTDEMLLSSDSSSGCQTNNTFLGNDNDGASQHQQIFDSGSVAVLSEQQQMHSQQMALEFGPFNGSAYSSLGTNSHLFNQHPGHTSVPPSPNTRRRAFNFMPISPRNTPIPETRSSTQSPLAFASGIGSGHTVSSVRSSVAPTAPSQPASTTTSPFVSPRSTPSSLCRSRHNSGQASSAFGTPRATPHPTYVMEQQQSCLNSPFVSPHPTPVPFSRSRHNSSQSMPRSGLAFPTGCAASSVPTRSRHQSELGLSMLSPGSAPMSPLEHHGPLCDNETSNGPLIAGGGHYTMPSVSDASQMRSRHNSNSSMPPNSPHSAPMSPMVTTGSHLMDSYSPEQTVPYGKAMLISSPGPSSLPQRQSSAMSDALNDEPRKPAHISWPTDPMQSQAAFGAEGSAQTPTLQTSGSWPMGVSLRQVDPRLISRQRHSSVGSAVLHHPPVAQQAPLSDASSQEVCHLMQKPPPLPQLELQASSRSHSVPLGQMLQNAFKQFDPTQPFNDVLMSRSYPATPVGQSSFTFGTDPCMDSDMGPPLSAEFSHFSGGSSEGDQLYQGDQFGCDSGQRDALDLPQDQFQDMIPSNLDEYITDEFSKLAQELEQIESSSTQS